MNFLPTQCPSCNGPIQWSASKTDLICTTDSCPSKGFQTILSFFEILEIDAMGPGTVQQLYNSGFDSVEKILKMGPLEFGDLDGFGKRKAHKVYDAIQSKLQDVKLHKLQHASNLFVGLGSTKLAALTEFNDPKQIPTIDYIKSKPGFALKSAVSFVTAYNDFWIWANKLPLTIDSNLEVVEVLEGPLNESIFVFSGFRAPDLEEGIAKYGGEMGKSINKKTTHLVLKDPKSTSSKAKKAKDLGVNILGIEDLEQLITSLNPLNNI